MINVSNEYKKIIKEDRRFLLKATLTLLDGTIFELDDSDIFQSGMSFDEATSGSNNFQIGHAYIGGHKLVLNNFDGKFDEYDFTGATIVPYQGLQLPETVEWLKKGVFTVDDPGTGGNIITLECLDNMHKFEKPFSGVEITFPTTAQLLLTAICTHCGVPLDTATFYNDDYVIKERPVDDALTCLDMVSYMAQVTGNYAKCNIDGALELKWYDTSVFEQSDHVDGGYYDKTEESTYKSGDSVDGGNFTDYTSSDNIDGGTFEQLKCYHHFYNLGSTPTISVDDVVITGIKVIYKGEEEESYTSLFGSEGYVLSIEDNPLIQSKSDADTVANAVGTRIVGMRFRPFSANVLSDPSVQAGDPCVISIRTSRGFVDYRSYVTSLSYTVGQRMRISCEAETPSRNSSTRYSAETKTIVENRKKIEKKLTAYNIAVQQLTNLMANSFGVYKTEEKQEDGSIIYYLHNKPTLAESQTIWKMTSDTFTVSTDGGKTWNAGFDSSGNVVVNILNAIGINADWVNAGTLRGIEIITNRGKIAGLNITDTGLASDNDIVSITNSYDSEGNPIYGNVKVRDTIPNPEKGIVDSYSEVHGDGFYSRAGLSSETDARTEASLSPGYGLNIITYDENNEKESQMNMDTTGLYQNNPSKVFTMQLLNGLENIIFSEDNGTELISQRKITLSAPEVEIYGYQNGTCIDGTTLANIQRQINYNLQYILNIVARLAAIGIDVDIPPSM